MHRLRSHRPLTALLGALAATLAVSLGAAGLPAASAHPAPSRSAEIPLPDGFQPEGITIGRGPFAYLGSLADGDIYRLNLRTGKGRVISQGPGTSSVGLKVDRRGRLFVSGGPAGDARVVDGRSGRILRSYQFATSDTFVNDVTLTRRVAWFTDSSQPRLYGVPLGKRGKPSKARFLTVPLRGQWKQVPDAFNANGITTTPDGRALLVVQSATGYLFRVSPYTGYARRVDLGGRLLTNGDGLLVKGHTLYAVQNRLNQVAVFHLTRSGRSGSLVKTLTAPSFDVPTTIAVLGRYAYLPNARFGTAQDPPTAEYSVTRVRR